MEEGGHFKCENDMIKGIEPEILKVHAKKKKTMERAMLKLALLRFICRNEKRQIKNVLIVEVFFVNLI